MDANWDTATRDWVIGKVGKSTPLRAKTKTGRVGGPQYRSLSGNGIWLVKIMRRKSTVCIFLNIFAALVSPTLCMNLNCSGADSSGLLARTFPIPTLRFRMGPRVNARELNATFGMTTLGRVFAIDILSRVTVLVLK
jgi:hypothetical protein